MFLHFINRINNIAFLLVCIAISNAATADSRLGPVFWSGTVTAKINVIGSGETKYVFGENGALIDGKFVKRRHLNEEQFCIARMASGYKVPSSWGKTKHWNSTCDIWSSVKSQNIIRASSKKYGETASTGAPRSNYSITDFNQFRSLEIKKGNKTVNTVTAFNEKKSFLSFKADGIFFLDGELCNWNSSMYSTSSTANFQAECPSGSVVKGQFWTKGSGGGSAGEGWDEADIGKKTIDKVTYELGPRKTHFSSKQKFSDLLKGYNYSSKSEFNNLYANTIGSELSEIDFDSKTKPQNSKQIEAMSSLTSIQLCRLATFKHKNKSIWHEGVKEQYADEAKRRGLSCGVEGFVDSVMSLSNYSDSTICSGATFNGNWNANQKYVEEARNRGLSCGVSVSNNDAISSKNKQMSLALSYLKDGKFVAARNIWEYHHFKGNVEATYQLGMLYYHGNGIEKNYKQAYIKFSEASQKMHPPSLLMLGIFFANGFHVGKNDDLAIDYFFKSHELSPNLDVKNWLGWAYLNGIGVLKNEQIAASYFREAAKLGSNYASEQLIKLSDNGNVAEKSDNSMQDAFNLAKSGEYDAARSIWEAEYQKGNEVAAHNLGVLYFNGDGIDKNFETAASYFTFAADKDYAQSHVYLGQMHALGYHFQKNTILAMDYFVDAHRLEQSAFTKDWLAWAYLNGIGVAADEKTAIIYLQQSADLGSDWANDELKRLNIDNTLDNSQIVSKSDKVLCDQATYDTNDGRFWHNPYTKFGSAVKEAKAKGLDCTYRNSVSKFAGLTSLELCKKATWVVSGRKAWHSNTQSKKYADEAKRRGLSCDVGQEANTTVASADAVSSDELRAAQKEADRLRDELAALKTQQAREQQTVASDNQIPLISASARNDSETNALVVGTVTDNVEVAELTIDGEPVLFNSNGSFEVSFYVPRNGKTIEIVAFDRRGNSSSKTLKLERGAIQQASGPIFSALNPSIKRVVENPNALALIVGIADYERTDARAAYADKDAQTFYDYARMKLGVPARNIKEFVNDGADEIEVVLAVRDWIARSTKSGQSDVYVFFAGHGLASDDGEQMYLLPYDGSPRLLEESAISRDALFQDIAFANPRSVTVFLDTCYSGTTRGTDMLIASRPIAIRAKQSPIPEGFTVFTAAGGDQTAKPLEEAKHGMFSYFLMKGMEGDADANNDNQITAAELHQYVEQNVVQQSAGSQVPELQGDSERVLVRFQ